MIQVSKTETIYIGAAAIGLVVFMTTMVTFLVRISC